MDILDIIIKRRSIREYKEKIPSEIDIRKVLEAGRWAPSGLNNQPWAFMVIKDKNKIKGLARFTKYGNIIKDAPVVIAVFMNIADSYNRDKDLMAIGASIQNMLLQAFSMGLGSCWLGEILNKKQEVIEYLKPGQDLELMAVITLGYPDEEITEGCRKPFKSIVLGDF